MENENLLKKVDCFVLQVLDEEQIAADFHCFISYTADDQKRKVQKYQENLKTLFLSLSEEELLPALSYYVERISKAYNKARLLTSLLHYCVVNNHVTPRLVCEALVKSPCLIYHSNGDFWCLSFKLIGEIISSIDYEGVRDLFKGIIEKANSIELAVNVSVMNQLRAIQKVLEMILDRRASLLPAYLVLEELQKKYPTGRPLIHSKFSNLIMAFIDGFRPVAQMLSISVFMRIKGEEGVFKDTKLLPIVGHSTTLGNVWRLDPVTAEGSLKGMLPYNKELLEPQSSLLRYVLKHSYSREMVCNMLGVNKLQKRRCPALEAELVELIVVAMDESDIDFDDMEDGCAVLLLWQHLASQLIYFVLFLYANFGEFICNLHNKLKYRKSLKGREHLMWMILQFISGSIQKKQKLNEFLSVMKLYDLLYPEKDALPIPDVSKASSVYILAAAAMWIHLKKKAQMEQANLTRKLPKALTSHLEYLQNTRCDSDLPLSLNNDYRIPLLCNAYSTSQECFTRPMSIIIEAVQGGTQSQTSGTSTKVPLSMDTLDSLTVHTKMSIIHSIVTYIASKLAPQKTTEGMSPALMETYARLLVYSEIESLGIKGFIEKLLPVVFQCHAWSILHTLLEMFSYRLHHFQPHYRTKLLNHLHGLSAVSQTNQTQLHICVESTALKLIVGMRSVEVQPQLSRLQAESKYFSNDSEELNKVLVLTIARSIHITGSAVTELWCQDIISSIMQHTPHCWSSFTLQCFPKVLRDFFVNHQVPRDMTQLKRSVEEEYKKWKTMSNEKDIILHFSRQGSSPLFLCLMWKMLLDQERISTIAYEILDRIGARALSTHLRAFADFLVYEFSISAVGQHITNYIQALNDLIWKCHAIQLDRLILCLALRNFEGNEAQVCFFVIQMLLLKPLDFKDRVKDFVENNSPEHWKQSDWHEKHMKFQRKHEEKFYFEGLRNINTTNSHHIYLPVYFGNVCLRFLPVMDIVIHRFIELPTASQLDNLLDELGCLYKFHDQPLTYLYDTLHYYEQKLCERPRLKKKLVATVIGSLKSIRPDGWALSEEYLAFIQDPSEEPTWVPDHEYYVKLIRRLVDTLGGKNPFPHLDWRFNEYTNEGAHALYVTCIELMALPVSTNAVGNAIVDIIHKSRTTVVYSNIIAWMNAVGLILTALPEAYLNVLHDRILDTMKSPILSNPFPSTNPFEMFDFAGSFNSMVEIPCSYLVGLTHSVWYHVSFGQICSLPCLLKEKFKPIVKTEVQFIFLCHLVAPFLQRFSTEKLLCIMEITVELYEMMEIVDKNCEEWQYIDCICDLLYHIKYMYTEDAMSNEIEKSIRNLRPEIQHKLRFITHLNLGEIAMEI